MRAPCLRCVTRRCSSSQLWLIGTAVFALLWAIARASAQSITIDEADSFLIWAARSSPSHWQPASNNHVLNSLLMRLFTSIFGVSHLTVRAPALLGAALYISAACCLSRLLTRDFILQWPLFVCLVYNPFVFDYLVAARGYSLAVGLMMCAVAVAAHCHSEIARGRPRPLPEACALCSICLALSFAANFSFAFVDAAALLMIFLWAGRRRTAREKLRLLAACVLPGLLVTVFLSASVVLDWPRGQLWYGARSLRQTLRSVVDASLYQLNPQIVNPLLYPFLNRLKPFLLPLLGAFCVWRLLLILRSRSLPREAHAAWLAALGTALVGTVALSLSVHRLSYRLFHLLLPIDRTALYLAPLCTLIAGVAAAFPLPSRMGRLSQRGLILMLFLVASYFLLCLRLTYFKEWRWDGDTKAVYSVLAFYNHAYGVRDVPANWQYVAALNFYRVLSGRETFTEFTNPREYPADSQLFVLNGVFDRDFIARRGLKVVYQGELSEVVVAVRPGALSAALAGRPVPGRP